MHLGAALFLYPRPLGFAPGDDGVLVAFDCPPCGTLATPAQPGPQDRPGLGVSRSIAIATLPNVHTPVAKP